MSEKPNVIVLGAGFSHDAGIPLLNNFIKTMLDIAVRGSLNGKPLEPSQINVIRQAEEIRGELDNYHGRANFDDRNIEDILSILAFNVLGGGTSERKQLATFTNAVAATVQASCKLTNPIDTGLVWPAFNNEPDIYRAFWRALLAWAKSGNKLPTIITLNYDLVLELSLLQVLNSVTFDNTETNRRCPFSAFEVRYHHFDEINETFLVRPHIYVNKVGDIGTRGMRTESIGKSSNHSFEQIDILKLHGSLNFPRRRPKEAGLPFAIPVENPHIFPPVSNKLSDDSTSRIWKQALISLRSARNVAFVGYSLPATDIYMQYFLKAAFGPNRGLDKISIFDPALAPHKEKTGLRERYENCFSNQMRQIIDFAPDTYDARTDPDLFGTTQHFVNMLANSPESILF